MESYLLLCLLWAAELAGTGTVAGTPFAGPYILYAVRFEKCEEGESNDNMVIHAVASPFNKREPYSLQTMTGNISYKDTLDDTYWGRARLDSRSSDGHRWVKNSFIFNFPSRGCSVFREHIPGLTRALWGNALPPSGKPCIIPPGVYNFENAPVNWTLPSIPIMPYGNFRMYLTAGQRRDITEFCEITEINFIPRPKPGKNG